MTLVSTPIYELHLNGQPVLRLSPGTPITIGRDSANELVLPDAHVSRRHAELRLQGDTPTVRDLGSSNGTTVNGESLLPDVERRLVDGDTLGIGPYELVFRAAGSAIPAPLPETREEAPASPRGRGALAIISRRIRAAVLAAVLVIALLVGVAEALLWLLAPPAVTILLLGSDARPGELSAGDRGRTDTLVAYIADRAAGRNLLVSVPRDLWVQTSPSTSGKINTAYRVGGATGAKQAVGATLGIPIDRHVVIGLQGVRDIVDALGGIDVTVEKAIRDEQYPTDDYGTTVFELAAGRQHLDGETALRYARTRHADDDLARIGRQQQVMQGIREAMTSPANLWRMPGTLEAIRRSTDTDLGPGDVATVIAAYLRAPGAPERFTPSWNAVLPFMAPGGEAALRPQPEFRNELAALLIGARTRIEVQNASGRNGVAGSAGDLLSARGLTVVRVTTAERPRESSLVQVRSQSRLAGQSIASLLGLGTSAVQESSDLPTDADVRVTLGASYRAP